MNAKETLSETRVRIEKQTKLNEIAAPTLNSISKVCSHHFQDFKQMEKKPDKSRKKS